MMYHAACKVEFSTIQTVVLTADVFQLFIKTSSTSWLKLNDGNYLPYGCLLLYLVEYLVPLIAVPSY